jgi:hypothetical protein
MEINLKKTKIMIFQKSTKKQQIPVFSIGNRILQITQEYTYLGLKLTPTGKFTLAMKTIAA